MPRLLWLAFEKPPHPDAVVHPADEGQIELVLELLQKPPQRRSHLAEQLRNYLAQQNSSSMFVPRPVPFRRSSGLYQLVPWRLAKWLSQILTADQGVIDRTKVRMHQWLTKSNQNHILRPKARNKLA